MIKAENELIESDYKFMKNCSKNTLSKLISLYFEYLDVVEREHKEALEVESHIKDEVKQYLNAAEAEMMSKNVCNIADQLPNSREREPFKRNQNRKPRSENNSSEKNNKEKEKGEVPN